MKKKAKPLIVREKVKEWVFSDFGKGKERWD